MSHMKNLLLTLALVGCLFGSGTLSAAEKSQPVSAKAAKPAALLQRVNTADGVTRSEADSIADAYFLLHVGCGSFTGISETPTAWVVEGRVGRGATPLRNFLIDKSTGAIHSPIGPSYVHPNDMLKPENAAKQNRL